MTAIIIPRKHLAQPQGRVRIRRDWEPRLASLLHFSPSGARDLADQAANYAPVGAAAIDPHANGLGLRTGAGGTTNGYVESSGAMAGWSGNPTLVFFLPEIAASQGANGAMLHAIPAATQYTQITPSGDAVYVLGQGAYSIGENILGKRNHTLILRATSQDPAWFSGRRKTDGVTGTIGTGAKTVRYGAWSSAGWQFNGVYGSVATVKGFLSDAEAYDLIDYPWLFYEADPIRIYSLPSGAITLNSLTMSNITQTSTRATLGLTR